VLRRQELGDALVGLVVRQQRPEQRLLRLHVGGAGSRWERPSSPPRLDEGVEGVHGGTLADHPAARRPPRLWMGVDDGDGRAARARGQREWRGRGGGRWPVGVAAVGVAVRGGRGRGVAGGGGPNASRPPLAGGRDASTGGRLGERSAPRSGAQLRQLGGELGLQARLLRLGLGA
jgi:hypothetical protein